MRAHQNIAVFGCGPLGMLVMAVAKAYGAKTIIASDISPHRLAFAKQYAATHTFVPPKRNEDQEIMAWNRDIAGQMIKEAGLDMGVDLVVECSGAEAPQQLGITLLRHGGTCE